MKSISRRSFCWTAAVGSLALPSLARAQSRYAMEHVVIEWSYSSQKPYKDPFNELELDVVFTDPQRREERVPPRPLGAAVDPQDEGSRRVALPAAGRSRRSAALDARRLAVPLLEQQLHDRYDRARFNAATSLLKLVDLRKVIHDSR